MKSLPELNEALLRALGFADVKGINGLILQLSPDKPPVVTVQRLVIDDITKVADDLKTVVDIYSLEPKEQPK
jgi:hypothetical protein